MERGRKGMEKFNTLKMCLLTWFGGIAGVIINLLGGWTEDLNTLFTFMAVDFILGLAVAGFWKSSNKSKSGALNSYSLWRGLIRKGGSLAVVIIGNRLDITMGTDYMRTAIIIAFIANEALSIVENLGIMGVPLPKVLIRAIDVLKSKSEDE